MSTNTFGLKGPETYEGQWARIARIIGTDYGQNYNPQDLQRMGQHELYAVERDCLAQRFTLPSIPVPAEWAEMDRRAAQRQLDTIEPAKRFKAQLWDPARCKPTYLGVFATEEERDACIEAARVRRQIGLPVRVREQPRPRHKAPVDWPASEPAAPSLPADFVWPEPQGVQEFLDRMYPVPGENE